MDKRYYITTSIAYASKKPHIGNNYEHVLADSIARYKRQTGYDVFFMTGTDEHGEKIQANAKEAGMKEQEYVDKVSGEIKDILKLLNISYDKFIRTTDDYHKKGVQKIFEKLLENDDIYLGDYEGWYCVPCESFWTETQAKDGKCPDCGREVKKSKEEAYFFKLSKYQDRLIKHIEDNPGFIQPESRKNEMINNFLKPGLQDLCVTRTSFDWGIKTSNDPKHVIYVWIDALSNYITGLGYNEENDELYKKYWPADVHLIGKDILRFHTIYWPIMLMALDIPLPKEVFGHPWLLVGDEKMSKSKGNVIYADDLVKEFGIDSVRYFVLRETPFAQDGSITYEQLITRTNADLCNTLGNLVSRLVAMINQYFGGSVYKRDVEKDDIDNELMDMSTILHKKVDEKMEQLRVADALEEIWVLLRRCNKYIDETMPWILFKDETNKDRLNDVLYNLAESTRICAVLLSSFIPETSEKILNQLVVTSDHKTYDSITTFGLKEEYKVSDKKEILFNRIDPVKKLAELNKGKEPEKEDKREYITIDEFDKINLRTAKVLECEKIEGSDKLLKLQVELSGKKRQIVSGISKHYAPSEMIGKTVVIVENLKPVKLKGELSEGMILAASDNDGNLKVVEIDMPPGSEVR